MIIDQSWKYFLWMLNSFCTNICKISKFNIITEFRTITNYTVKTCCLFSLGFNSQSNCGRFSAVWNKVVKLKLIQSLRFPLILISSIILYHYLQLIATGKYIVPTLKSKIWAVSHQEVVDKYERLCNTQASYMNLCKPKVTLLKSRLNDSSLIMKSSNPHG